MLDVENTYIGKLLIVSGMNSHSANSADRKYLIATLLVRDHTNLLHVHFRDRLGLTFIFCLRESVTDEHDCRT